jgi:DNA-directed RNA polymerase beta subunit
MAGAKPLNLREWIDLSNLTPPLTRDLVLRIEATVEAGRFLPEPLSERELHAWLLTGDENHGRRDFDEDDLGRALHKARLEGPVPAIYGVRNDGWVVEYQEEHRCADLAAVARTVAALAYREVHAEADVRHLLGDQRERSGGPLTAQQLNDRFTAVAKELNDDDRG